MTLRAILFDAIVGKKSEQYLAARKHADEARAKAIEECAEVADKYHHQEWSKDESQFSRGYGIGYKLAGKNIAKEIRSLLPTPAQGPK